MSKDHCDQAGCDGAIFAKGKCGRHYMQERRGKLGETAARAPNGEGDEITFRILKAERARLEALADRLKTTPSALCRRAVASLLAQLDPPKQGALFKVRQK